jgi:phospholipase C
MTENLALFGARRAACALVRAARTCQRGKSVNQLVPLALAALCLTAPASAQITSFQHVILVIQENRTPDNMFQGLCPSTTPSACSTQPGPGQYDIKTTAWLDKTSPTTGTTNPKAVPFGLGWDMLHAHSAWVTDCDLNMYGACAMDGAADAEYLPHAQKCPTKPAYSYIDNSTGAVQPQGCSVL